MQQANDPIDQRRVEMLQKFPNERRRAVCEFPLRVASMALQMSKLLTLYEQLAKSSDVSEYDQFIDYIEQKIRSEYLKLFGEPMAGRPDGDPE